MKKVCCIFLFIIFFNNAFSQFNPYVSVLGGGQFRVNSEYDKPGYITQVYIGNVIPLKSSRIVFKLGLGIENNVHENNDVGVNDIKSISTKFTYNSVPVLIEYHFSQRKKFYPVIAGGIVFTRTLSSEKQTESLDGSVVEGFDSRYTHNSPFYFQGSVGCGYELMDRFDLCLVSDIRYNTVRDNPYDNLYCVPWSMTIQIGLSYRFIADKQLN